MKFNSGYIAQPIQTKASSIHIVSRPSKSNECLYCTKNTGKCKMKKHCNNKTKSGYCRLPL